MIILKHCRLRSVSATHRWLRPLILLTLITGCVTAPPVEQLPNELSDDDASLFGGETRLEHSSWWEPLGDGSLHQLIQLGLQRNPSPQAAMARLAQAQADLAVAKSMRWPSLLGSGSRQVQRFNGSDPNTRSDTAGLNLVWDAGLWGKRRLLIDDAQQFSEQRWFEHKAVELALSTSIAETYYQIVELKAQIALLENQIQVSRELERLIEARFRLGQAPVNEVYQQREQTAQLVQFRIEIDTQLEVFEKSLDVLLGRLPDSESRVARANVPVAPELQGLGEPAGLVVYRADIRAAYARVRQAAARVGIRFTERLPSLRVNAELTSAASKLLSSEWFGYGLDLAAPIFTGGRLKNLEARAMHVLEEERQLYLEVWRNAVEEVATLKWQHTQQQSVIDTLQARRGFAQQALDASRNRYVLGDQNYLDVLTALRGLQEADRNLVSERRQLITLWIRTVEAIGQPMCLNEPECGRVWRD